jgi:hypothetical protein
LDVGIDANFSILFARVIVHFFWSCRCGIKRIPRTDPGNVLFLHHLVHVDLIDGDLFGIVDYNFCIDQLSSVDTLDVVRSCGDTMISYPIYLVAVTTGTLWVQRIPESCLTAKKVAVVVAPVSRIVDSFVHTGSKIDSPTEQIRSPSFTARRKESRLSYGSNVLFFRPMPQPPDVTNPLHGLGNIPIHLVDITADLE